MTLAAAAPTTDGSESLATDISGIVAPSHALDLEDEDDGHRLVGKWPAAVRLQTVAAAGHLPTSYRRKPSSYITPGRRTDIQGRRKLRCGATVLGQNPPLDECPVTEGWQEPRRAQRRRVRTRLLPKTPQAHAIPRPQRPAPRHRLRCGRSRLQNIGHAENEAIRHAMAHPRRTGRPHRPRPHQIRALRPRLERPHGQGRCPRKTTTASPKRSPNAPRERSPSRQRLHRHARLTPARTMTWTSSGGFRSVEAARTPGGLDARTGPRRRQRNGAGHE